MLKETLHHWNLMNLEVFHVNGWIFTAIIIIDKIHVFTLKLASYPYIHIAGS